MKNAGLLEKTLLHCMWGVVVLFLFVLRAGAVAWAGQEEKVPFSRDELQTLSLTGVRQFIVAGKGVGAGKMLVISGEVVNEGLLTCGAVRVTGALFDENDVRIVEKERRAGMQLSQDELATLDKTDIEELLGHDQETLAGGKIPPGGTVSFMLVFFHAPMAATFEVSVSYAEHER